MENVQDRPNCVLVCVWPIYPVHPRVWEIPSCLLLSDTRGHISKDVRWRVNCNIMGPTPPLCDSSGGIDFGFKSACCTVWCLPGVSQIPVNPPSARTHTHLFPPSSLPHSLPTSPFTLSNPVIVSGQNQETSELKTLNFSYFLLTEPHECATSAYSAVEYS